MRGEPSSRLLLHGGLLMPAKGWNLPAADETKTHPDEEHNTDWLVQEKCERIETYSIKAWFRQRADEFVQGVVGAVAKGGFTCDSRRSSKPKPAQADGWGQHQNRSRM